jgi:hypothetical protein
MRKCNPGGVLSCPHDKVVEPELPAEEEKDEDSAGDEQFTDDPHDAEPTRRP